ncbi:MAG: hypothetical protein HN353_05735 [Bdellovibrionales bacterium]|jgi:uncharacterized protein|nr:hypothetical protein [Bdellovibrionales bacterium]MBT3525057.1 hypothetical protein [Bdellovibrionales bacterium]MBT7767422.1 hypothetical protein [Bdellovibrionales bacterium]
MITQENIALNFDQDIEEYIHQNYSDVREFRILKKGLDARGIKRGRKPIYNYLVELAFGDDNFEPLLAGLTAAKNKVEGPIIVGMGPAGLFCALRLLERGVPSIILERGDPVNERMRKIARFWRHGVIDPESNISFGEGGAGLFSDGKLITRIKSGHLPYVMDRLVKFGAPESTAYLAAPHLGSNRIRAILQQIVAYLKAHGCQLHYQTKVEQLLFDTTGQVRGVKTAAGREFHSAHLVMATGHSARDIYQTLDREGVALRAKDFAIGVRVEHPRALIDRIQYHKFANHPALDAANYRLSYHHKPTDRGTYSFCMCPGGHILAAATDKGEAVVNGMSNHRRHAPWSNSALVVSVKSGVDFNLQGSNPLAGVEFQRKLEQRAFVAAQGVNHAMLPAQNLANFMRQGSGGDLPSSSTVTSLGAVAMEEVLPPFVLEHLRRGIERFEQQLPGFISDRALVVAPESRTSAPVTILRDSGLYASVSHSGLYPCGEGAGYAGGITSAAVDGVSVAEAILAR